MKTGNITYGVLKDYLTDVELVHEGLICKTVLDTYEHESMVLELAGALSLACVYFILIYFIVRKYQG